MNRCVGRILDLPKGWRVFDKQSHKGWIECDNGKSMFSDDYQWCWLFDQEWWEYKMHRAELDYRERLDRAKKALTDEQKEYWLNRVNILKIFGGVNK